MSGLSQNQQKIFDLIRVCAFDRKATVSYGDIAKVTGLGLSSIRQAIEALISKGYVEKDHTIVDGSAVCQYVVLK